LKKDGKFETLFQEQLEDLYDAEKQLAGALPAMIAASSSPDLSGILESALEDAREQVSRLEALFEGMAEEPGARQSRVMQALLDEGQRFIDELEKSTVLDAALIATVQKVKHHEIAGYATACGLAEMLGQQEAFGLLQETLEEETQSGEELADLYEAILTGDIASKGGA